MYRGTISDSSKPSNSKSTEDESSNSEDDPINWYYGLTIFIIIASCAAYVSTLTLIPYQDVFVYPSFWWQNLIIFGFLYAGLRVTLSLIREIFLVFKTENIMTLQFYLKIFLGTALGFSIHIVGSTFIGQSWKGTITPCRWLTCFATFSLKRHVGLS